MRLFKQLIISLLLLLLLIVPEFASAEPWYTGPLLAQSGKTMPKGHIDIEPFFFDTRILGNYNAAGQLEAVPALRNQNYSWLFFYGISDDFDFQFTLPYNQNTSLGTRYSDIGDLSILFGWQLWRQGAQGWLPNLRLTVQETLPSGRYDKMNPANNGIEITGLGSYQTVVTLNFDYQHRVYDEHYLQAYLNLGMSLMSDVTVVGPNAYGGGLGTRGEVSPGTQFFTVAAVEYNLTQHWVGVFELYYSRRQASTFIGAPGRLMAGDVATMGNGRSRNLSIVPAIEYNFSKNLGIIAGVWFSLSGAESSRFVSTVIAVNYYL